MLYGLRVAKRSGMLVVELGLRVQVGDLGIFSTSAKQTKEGDLPARSTKRKPRGTGGVAGDRVVSW